MVTVYESGRDRAVVTTPSGRQVDLQELNHAAAGGDVPDETRAAIDELRSLVAGRVPHEDPIDFPAHLCMHACCAKRKANHKPQVEHGVSFVRSGDDAVAIAFDDRVAVRVVLPGSAAKVPEQGVVIPAVASEWIAATYDAETEPTAQVWFGARRVLVRARGELHSFPLLDVLPFPVEEFAMFADLGSATSALRHVRLDATTLQRLQRALGASWLELVQSGKGSVFALPDGLAGDVVGRIGLHSEIEVEEA